MLRRFLEQRPAGLEVVLTGRDPSPALCAMADYITEMKKQKHPYDTGVLARRGSSSDGKGGDMSHILCVVDGMTDAAFTAADYPHLSAMECAGRVDTTQGGRTESLNCILHLLGQTRVPPHLRGYAEALAEDIPLEPGDLISSGKLVFCG